MDLVNTPFFGLLRARLGQLSERQRLISENIANASTPGYRPRDIDTTSFDQLLQQQSGVSNTLQMTRTNPGHMTMGGDTGQATLTTGDDSETTIDGNAVVIEDQMAKAQETRMQFETGLALYQKGLDLLKMAARAPGR